MRVLTRSLDGGLEMRRPTARRRRRWWTTGRSTPSHSSAAGAPTSPCWSRPAARASHPVTLTLAAAEGTSAPPVTCVDPLDGRVPRACENLRAAGPTLRAVRARMPARGGRVFESVDVTGRASLSVEEILARWQAAREAERAGLDNYAVDCFLVLHFEGTSLQAGSTWRWNCGSSGIGPASTTGCRRRSGSTA